MVMFEAYSWWNSVALGVETCPGLCVTKSTCYKMGNFTFRLLTFVSMANSNKTKQNGIMVFQIYTWMNFAAVSIGTWALNKNYISEMKIFRLRLLTPVLRGLSTQQMTLLCFGFTTDETLLLLLLKRVLRDLLLTRITHIGKGNFCFW